MTTKYVVAVYLSDRAYGGPEEGGWWYDTGALVRILKVFSNSDKARRYQERLSRWLNLVLNKGRRDIGSVLSTGWYYAEIHENVAPAYYPETVPHYE